jgi:acetylornithine/N-succinyldiaminopimelate aminotransferase
MTAVMSTYGRYNLAFERGEGPYLYATDGRRFLDFGTGIAVTALGHCHPHLVKALQEQAGKLWHCSNLYNIPGQIRLAERLAENSFGDAVFFCNSGLEAMEAAIKLSRRYHHQTGNPQRWRTITVEGCFHGRSLATISAAKNPKHLEGFGKPVDGFDQVPFGNLNALRAAITDETACIALEPVQGESGIFPSQLDYIRELRKIADEFGILLVLDEVQCGMGRTGKLFAHEWAGVTPDVMALAKGLGGGFPIGAIIATAEAAKGLTPGTHGSTFGGNPLASAASNAVLDVMLADGFMEGVDKKARKFWKDLKEVTGRYPNVYETVRGAGLMLGIKCVAPAGEVITKYHEAGLLPVPAGDNVVRMLPPLIAEEEHFAEALDVIDTVGRNWGSGGA